MSEQMSGNSDVDLQQTYEMLADMSIRADKGIHLYIRYKHGPKRLIQLTCRRGQVACNLAETIICNLKRFRINTSKEDDIGPGDVVINAIKDDGTPKEIHPGTPLKDIEQLTLVFDIDLCKVKIVHMDSCVSIFCRQDETMSDLANKIQGKLDEFSFPSDYLKGLKDKLDRKGQIRIYKHPSGFGYSAPLDPTKKVADFDHDQFTFSVEAFQKYITSEDIQEEICGQNIVFFGVPKHGKSSTINSLIKAITGKRGQAETFPEGSLGTELYRPYPVHVNAAKFWLSDVPGSCGLSETDIKTGRSLEEQFRKAIKRILEGKLSERVKPADYMPTLALAKGFEKPSAVVIIQKWDATIDEFNRYVLEEASSRKRGLKTFLIVTHMDQAPDDPVEVHEKLKDMADTLGIDLSNVFTITNLDQEANEFRDMKNDRRNNALAILKEILQSAKICMNKGETTSSFFI